MMISITSLFWRGVFVTSSVLDTHFTGTQRTAAFLFLEYLDIGSLKWDCFTLLASVWNSTLPRISYQYVNLRSFRTIKKDVLLVRRTCG